MRSVVQGHKSSMWWRYSGREKPDGEGIVYVVKGVDYILLPWEDTHFKQKIDWVDLLIKNYLGYFGENSH